MAPSHQILKVTPGMGPRDHPGRAPAGSAAVPDEMVRPSGWAYSSAAPMRRIAMTHPPPARPELDAASLFRVFSCVVFTLTLLGAVTGPVFAADCTFRYQVTGSIPNQAFGSAVATIGDVNGDGIPDFAVGA